MRIVVSEPWRGISRKRLRRTHRKNPVFSGRLAMEPARRWDTQPIHAMPCYRQLTLNFRNACGRSTIRRRKAHGVHVFPSWC